jgi:hypothetical protein
VLSWREENSVHTECKRYFLQPLTSITRRLINTYQNLQKKTHLVIYFSSIHMDQQRVYVRGCKRDSLHPVCKELFSEARRVGAAASCYSTDAVIFFLH